MNRTTLILGAAAVVAITCATSGLAFTAARLEISVSSATGVMDYFIVGQRADATDGFDNAYDTPMFHADRATFVETYFDHPEWHAQFSQFRGDIRSYGSRDEWTVTVSTNLPAGTELTLALRPGSEIPAGYTLTVEDTVAGKSADLRGGSYKFQVTSAKRLLKVVTTAAAATAPGKPTAKAAEAGSAMASVSFVAPTENGGSPILDYTVTAYPGGKTATGAGSPIVVSGLTNGETYIFKVQARNAVGFSAASAATDKVTPQHASVPRKRI